MKHITPGSIWITGLPNTDAQDGIRDNGSGQMWSLTTRVGYVNYWTGDVVLDQKYVPRARPWDALLASLGLKSGEAPQITCEFDVSDLNLRTQDPPPVSIDLTYSINLTKRTRKR
jgi:hypothetical protein